MTDQQNHAVVGKTREDYRNAKKELAALESSADELAKYAEQIKDALSEPHRIVFFTGTPTIGNVKVLTDVMFQKLSADNIKKLAADIKRVKATINALRQQLIELEGEDPEGSSEGRHRGPFIRRRR